MILFVTCMFALLVCFGMALYGFVKLIKEREWLLLVWPLIVFGLAIGVFYEVFNSHSLF